MDDLDLESIYHAEGSSTAEMETMAIREVLESNGIEAIVAGDSLFPNLPFEIKVLRREAPLARQLIAEARSAGPAAAEAAERESELGQA